MLGATPRGCALLPRARGSDSFRSPLAPAGDHPPAPTLLGDRDGRGRRARAPCRAGRRARSGQGRAGGLRAGAARVQAGPSLTRGPWLCHHHQRAAGVGRLVAVLGRHPGGDGIDLRLLEGVYWLLEAEGFDCWLVNARDVKNVPGRPKTDRQDAIWLARIAERGMCRPSLVQPRPIRQLRDLTRYRRSLIQDRTREMQRVEKLLEDAQIKLSSVVSDIFGVSGRAMLEALVTGQRDPKVLAQLAKARMRVKIAELGEALRGV